MDVVLDVLKTNIYVMENSNKIEKKIMKLTLFIGCYLLFSESIFTQSVNLHFEGGSLNSYNLSDCRKITFQGNQLQLEFLNTSTNESSLRIVEYLDFKESNFTNLKNENKNNLISDLKVYPNPTTVEFINIELPFQKEVYMIKILNSCGVVINEFNYSNLKLLKNKFEINVSNIDSGLYFLKIQTTSNNYTTNFIKL